MNPAPQILSNEIEDFQAGGGLYPGGTGIIEEFCYKLWDYDGKRPKDSQCAAYLRFRPIDGSNDNKPVEQYYSVGASADYMPDNTGGNVISMKGKQFIDSTNWGHFLKTLRNNCGLERGRLSSPTGIRAMQNGVMTLVKGEQPHRDFADELPKTGQADDKKKYPRTMLLPTKATFTWDPNYANATRNVPAPPQPGQAPQSMAQTQAPAPVYANGAPPAPASTPMTNSTAPLSDVSLSGIMKVLLGKNNGSLSTVGLPKLVLEAMIGAQVTREARVAIAKEAGDVNALATVCQANGWVLAGTDIVG